MVSPRCGLVTGLRSRDCEGHGTQGTSDLAGSVTRRLQFCGDHWEGFHQNLNQGSVMPQSRFARCSVGGKHCQGTTQSDPLPAAFGIFLVLKFALLQGRSFVYLLILCRIPMWLGWGFVHSPWAIVCGPFWSLEPGFLGAGVMLHHLW